MYQVRCSVLGCPIVSHTSCGFRICKCIMRHLLYLIVRVLRGHYVVTHSGVSFKFRVLYPMVHGSLGNNSQVSPQSIQAARARYHKANCHEQEKYRPRCLTASRLGLNCPGGTSSISRWVYLPRQAHRAWHSNGFWKLVSLCEATCREGRDYLTARELVDIVRVRARPAPTAAVKEPYFRGYNMLAVPPDVADRQSCTISNTGTAR